MSFSYIASVFFIITLCCCNQTDPNKINKPAYTGRQGEIIVVAPNKLWDSDEANYLRAGLLELFTGLPADEPLFTNVEVNAESFGDVFKTHRNLLIIKVDPSNKLNIVKRKDVFAKNQLQIIVTVNGLADLSQFSKSSLSSVLKEFHRAEINRLVSRNAAFGSADLNSEVKDFANISIILQENMELAKKQNGSLWLRLDREKPVGGYQHQINQGLLIYSRPYTDTAQFSDNSLLAWKTEINKTMVAGPKGSYMSISNRFIQPITQTINFGGNSAKEIRGLWRMEGAQGVHMGGPFYALAFYNAENQKQYMIEGYVYGPQFNKRAFIREIEAMVKSVKPVLN